MPLEIVRNDITTMTVDAIVNAAKPSLLGGGGVDGAIHRAAGPELLAECRTLGGCRTGEAKLTHGYALPSRYVIHTVGPVWQGGICGEREALAACYRSSLELARAHGCETIAFPLISAGAYGYPKDRALRVAVDTIGAFLMEQEMMVYLVIFDRDAYTISSKLFADIAEYIDDRYVDLHKDTNRLRMEMAEREYCVPTAAKAVSVGGLEAKMAELDDGFSKRLLQLIDRTGKKDSEIYKKANVDRKLFSKIKNNPGYQPSKNTAVAFALALELDLEETKDLLGCAGYALSHSSVFDIIIEYFIECGEYDVFHINEALFAYAQTPLGQ